MIKNGLCASVLDSLLLVSSKRQIDVMNDSGETEKKNMLPQPLCAPFPVHPISPISPHFYALPASEMPEGRESTLHDPLTSYSRWILFSRRIKWRRIEYGVMMDLRRYLPLSYLLSSLKYTLFLPFHLLLLTF